ncbi:MAG TPA: outer membrane beta-barrel protein [Longimicrobiaceae bacterium]|nr:outer membrane beta-barrel protein [Longimicrobiaceae bacterium]
MKRFALVAAALAAAAVAAPAKAQSPIAVEGRVGIAYPTGDFGEGLGLGYAIGANVSLNVTPQIAVYGGYTHTQFDFDDDLVDTDETYNLQGFDAGARLSLPMAGLSPYLRGGVVYYKGGVSDGPDSDNQLGFQAGVGLNYTLGPTVSFTPEVSYVNVPDDAGDASFVRADVGLRFRL